MCPKHTRDSLHGRTCYPLDDLVDYVLGQTNRLRDTEITKHSLNCKRCRFELVKLKRAFEEMDRIQSETPPAEIKEGRERVRNRLRERLGQAQNTASDEDRVEDLWREHDLARKVAASAHLDLRAKKAILEVLGLWEE